MLLGIIHDLRVVRMQFLGGIGLSGIWMRLGIWSMLVGLSCGIDLVVLLPIESSFELWSSSESKLVSSSPMGFWMVAILMLH